MSDKMLSVDDLLRGSIDMHVHYGPDIMPYRFDALELAEQAQKAGMRGIVLKSHWYPTAPLAIMINKLVPELDVFGTICLDCESGGLNVYALEASAKLGAKMVWMPTFSSTNSMNKMKALGLPVEGMRLFVATMLRKGLTPEEIEFMVKVNPAKLLDLE